jgi:hypothetical protein
VIRVTENLDPKKECDRIKLLLLGYCGYGPTQKSGRSPLFCVITASFSTRSGVYWHEKRICSGFQ